MALSLKKKCIQHLVLIQLIRVSGFLKFNDNNINCIDSFTDHNHVKILDQQINRQKFNKNWKRNIDVH